MESLMRVENFKLKLHTQGFCDIHDLTPQAQSCLAKSDIKNGQATFFVVGSTAGLTTVEYEPGLLKDLKKFYEKIIPQEDDYHHEETWHDGNGFSHVRASLLKPHLVVPIVDGLMTLGTWQQVIVIDFDNRPRTREIVFQLMGT